MYVYMCGVELHQIQVTKWTEYLYPFKPINAKLTHLSHDRIVITARNMHELTKQTKETLEKLKL